MREDEDEKMFPGFDNELMRKKRRRHTEGSGDVMMEVEREERETDV